MNGHRVEDYATEVDQVNVDDPVRAELDELRDEVNTLRKFILEEAQGA